MYSSDTVSFWALLDAVPKPLLMLIAFSVLTLGTVLLWRSWQSPETNNFRTLRAWVVITLSLPLFITTSGAEFGLSIAVLLIAVIAWVVIAKQLDVKPLRALPQSKLVNATSSKKMLISAQVFALLVLCPIVSLGATMLFGSFLPTDLAGQLVVDALLYPIVWALFAIWLLYTAKFWRWSAVYLMFSLVSLWAIFG